MELERARAEYKRLQERVKAINHAVSLIFFDGETAAPSNTADNRIHALAVLNATNHRLKYGEETERLVDFLSEHADELTLIERRSLEIIKRDAAKRKNIPREKYVSYENLLVSAQDAWHRAIYDQNYGIFRPFLEEVFSRFRDLSTYNSAGLGPYDYYLDTYERGMNTEVYDGIMDGIKKEVIPLFREISERPQPDDSCLKGDFSAEKQTELANYIMRLLGLDLDHVSLSTAEHPFSRSMGAHYDVRIVTKYSRRDFTISLYTLLFECAHALCLTGQDDAIAYTFVDDSASLGILGSQTYFYENGIGKSLPFIELIYPELKRLFPDTVGGYSPEDIYLAVNKVAAGPIRIGSDQLTSVLHLLIRYELEKALMDQSLTVRDLPDAWAEKYRDYLGVEVTDPVQGVLQDMHWAHGSIGSFPTMVLGNCYSAIIAREMQKDVDLIGAIKDGDFYSINHWNRENIWTKAGLYDTSEVIAGITDKPINSDAYVNYLKSKFASLYNL